MRFACFPVLRFLCALVFIGSLVLPSSILRADAAYWEAEVTQLTKGDESTPANPGAVLFIGSSSIRLWKTLASDFAPLRTINRGFGGAKTDEVLHFLPRLLAHHAPRQVVIYSGTNDVADGRSADRVLSDVQALCLELRRTLPQARLTFIAIAPNPARWHLRSTLVEVNTRVKTWLETQPNMTFVDIWPKMLNSSGEPRPELFVEDQLHMNALGYALWREVVGPALLPES